MLTKTLLTLSLITGTFSIANYSLPTNNSGQLRWRIRDRYPQTIAQLPT